jgi:hypothetical protein
MTGAAPDAMAEPRHPAEPRRATPCRGRAQGRSEPRAGEPRHRAEVARPRRGRARAGRARGRGEGRGRRRWGLPRNGVERTDATTTVSSDENDGERGKKCRGEEDEQGTTARLTGGPHARRRQLPNRLPHLSGERVAPLRRRLGRRGFGPIRENKKIKRKAGHGGGGGGTTAGPPARRGRARKGRAGPPPRLG